MPVFISYSHSDKEFVDRLATNLFSHRVHVWVDRWELRVGDSIISKVQEAIESSSALLVVLSKASVASEWCKKELTAGLIRELEEKRIVVLPVLVEDCSVPLMLRDKLYADFRSGFDAGLRVVIESIASVTSSVRSRISSPEFLTDWAVDWGDDKGQFSMRVTFIEHSQKYPFSCLTEVTITPNEAALRRYEETRRLRLGWFGRNAILESIAGFAEKMNIQVLLEDQFPKYKEVFLQDSKSDKGYHLFITSRWLGEDTGRDLAVNISGQLVQVRDHIRKTARPLQQSELDALGITVTMRK
jgi:hypothetical protein